MDPEDATACCTSFYEHELVSKLLGDNFHPGGEELTKHIGERLGLNRNSRALDVACGPGASVLTLAATHECLVTGVDLSETNLAKARDRAEELGLAAQAEFVQCDAQALDLKPDFFDAVISECSLCTFADADRSAAEMFRVLKPGGRVAISDVVLEGELPPDLEALVYRAACVSGARSSAQYMELLRNAGFTNVTHEDHGYTLRELLTRFKGLVQGWKVIEQFCGCDPEQLFGVTSAQIEQGLERAEAELDSGRFSYGLFLGEKAGE